LKEVIFREFTVADLLAITTLGIGHTTHPGEKERARKKKKKLPEVFGIA